MKTEKNLFFCFTVLSLVVFCIVLGCDAGNGGDISNTGSNTGNDESTTVTFTITNVSDWTNAVNAIKNGGNDKTYTLTVNRTVSVPGTTNVKEADSSTFTFGGTTGILVTLKGTGTLTLSTTGALICMWGRTEDSEASGKLIIDGPALQGISGNNYSLVRTYYAGLELKSGRITGNRNQDDGGGIYVQRGDFIMSGGEISNNTVLEDSGYGYGGGVYVQNGDFIMTAGTISGNTADRGGGVYVYDYSFIMSGGEIKGNTATYGNGGGVYVGYGDFTMSDGEISNNNTGKSSSYGGGGGIFLDYSNFTMTGGTISANTSGAGGGVYVNGHSGYSFIMSGGEIKANTAAASLAYSASANGGGVCIVDFGSLHKTGGIIYGYTIGDENSNKVIDNTNAFYPNRGAAVFKESFHSWNPHKFRETTLGEDDNLDTTADTGW
ncbi:MAG: hypothetical protein LBG57_00005 [Treponema sp.]|nr:hypothetical protein [Treponema sp.]